MTLEQLTGRTGEWLRGVGPDSDIVISSRIRLARNLSGFPFVNRADRRQRLDIMDRCRTQIESGSVGSPILWLELNKLSENDRLMLVERHLVSRQHAVADKDSVRAVAIGENETFAIMVNEEDHLRVQVLRSGLQLTEAFEHISRIDNALEEHLDFAFSKRLGYLTACPTNVGTGIRVSVMLHLPALKLTGEIEKVRRAARDMHLAVRGLFGEGSDALGDFYQVSNQTTLGKAEQEILADFEASVVPQVIAYEKQARQALLRQRLTQLDDKVWRAWALLTNARVISTEEVLGLLSHLRLGAHLGRIDKVDTATINAIFLITQKAHLEKLAGQELDPPARRELRARIIREKLMARL